MQRFFVSEVHENEAFTAGVVNRHLEYWLKERGYKPLYYRLKKEGLLLVKLLRIVQAFTWYLRLPSDSIVLFHLPIIPRATKLLLKLLQRKGIFTVAILHDIDGLRFNNPKDLEEEKKVLGNFQHVIVHNTRMQSFVSSFYPVEQTSLLWLFDYYCSSDTFLDRSLNNEIAVAANLEKAVYVKTYLANWLQEHPDVAVHLYGGSGSKDILQRFPPNLSYHGAVHPDALPAQLEGSFGIVWDGTRLDTCDGPVGNYLRYNSPHKLSLYLAASLPVIVWNESAMAPWVIEQEVGIVAASWDDAVRQLNKLAPDTYNQWHQKAKKIGSRLRKGYYLNTVLEDIEKKLKV